MKTNLTRRADAAYWSRFWLVLSAAVSWISFVLSPDVEGLVAGVLLTGMAMVEFQVYRLFLAGDLRAAEIGWWNQCIFAALFVVYGGYHGTFATVPPWMQQSVDVVLQMQGLDESALQVSLLDDVRWFYYAVAIVGGVCQFWLALFYRTAKADLAP